MAYSWKLESHDPGVPIPAAESETLVPSADFVISRHRNGEVLSVFGDDIWDLSPYAGLLCRLNFAPATQESRRSDIYVANVATFKLICFYFLYGPRKSISPKTAYVLYDVIKRVFDHANENRVLMTQLGRFDRLVISLAGRITPSYARSLPRVLNELYAARAHLGFTIFDYSQTKRLQHALPKAIVRQTPYIPQRIYHYHLRRCGEMLTDFLEHSVQFEELFDYCLEVYREARGSSRIFDPHKNTLRPFNRYSDAFCGLTFGDAATKYGVYDVIARWLTPVNGRLGDLRITALSKYFSAVQFVGQMHLISYSGMRIDEVVSLRFDCLSHEKDKYLGDIYLLTGATTKTDPDDDARWVTSSAAQTAVNAMKAVARMRLKAAALDPRMAVHDLSEQGARLFSRGFEPWCCGIRADADPERRVHRTMDNWRERCPGLYDSAELVISEADWKEAVALTPTLDSEKYAIGATWTFTYHQLRRTLTCNAAASGIVTLPALQYQMKHQHEAMTRYYARNYSSLQMNESLRKDFGDEIIDALVRDAVSLAAHHYVSPHGQAHKQAKLRFVSGTEESALRRKAQQGTLSVRHNALGICLFAGECKFGGIDSVASCIGCSDVLVDARRKSKFESLIGVLEDELWDAGEDDGPDTASRRAQLDAMRRVIDVVLV